MPSKGTTNYKPQTTNKQTQNGPLVGIVMGSESDYPGNNERRRRNASPV